MALRELEIHGYRSLRSVRLPLQRLNVVTGPNGSGKSNLYRVVAHFADLRRGLFAFDLPRGRIALGHVGRPEDEQEAGSHVAGVSDR